MNEVRKWKNVRGIANSNKNKSAFDQLKSLFIEQPRGAIQLDVNV